MYKFLGNLNKFLLVLFILILTSCGTKKVSTAKTDIGSNRDSDILITKKLDNNTDSAIINNQDVNTINVPSNNSFSDTNDFTEEQNSDNETKANNNKIGFFSNKEKKLLFNKFIANKSSNIQPLQNNNIYIITDVVPIELTAFEYYKKFFKNYEVVGFSLFNYAKNLSINNIKSIAQMKGANTVIIKKVYDANKDIYIYDIIYLNGQLSSTFFWNRNSNEALPISTTLQNLPAKENTNKYSVASILKLKNLNSDTTENDNNINDSEKNNQNNAVILVNTSEMDKVRERLNTLVGLWIDSYDKSVVEIKEIPASVMVAKDNITNVGTQYVKYYGAYIAFSKVKKLEKYNSYGKINTSLDFKWKNDDLKFQFNSSGKNSVFLNYDKMPEVTMIRPFQEKGVLMVIFPNGEIRYYIPLGLEVSSKFVKKLYKNLPRHINGSEMSIGRNPNYGSGMYGWLVSTGVILLSLGLITLF